MANWVKFSVNFPFERKASSSRAARDEKLSFFSHLRSICEVHWLGMLSMWKLLCVLLKFFLNECRLGGCDVRLGRLGGLIEEDSAVKWILSLGLSVKFWLLNEDLLVYSWGKLEDCPISIHLHTGIWSAHHWVTTSLYNKNIFS